jgi:hypothetical protein
MVPRKTVSTAARLCSEGLNMLCGQCGNSAPDGNNFCHVCGLAIAQGKSPETVVSPTTIQPTSFSEPKTDGKAIASLVFGCLAFVFPAALLAIILGHLSLSDIGKSPDRMQGRGLAIAGLVLGYVRALAIPILFAMLMVALIPTGLRNHASQITAHQASAVSSIRALNASEIGYARAHPEKGFTCKLDDLVGSDGVYGWMDRALAGGKKNGYLFTLQNCLPSTPEGPITRYQITGYPEQDRTHLRAFCSDESAVIRYDISGSAQNCLDYGPAL